MQENTHTTYGIRHIGSVSTDCNIRAKTQDYTQVEPCNQCKILTKLMPDTVVWICDEEPRYRIGGYYGKKIIWRSSTTRVAPQLVGADDLPISFDLREAWWEASQIISMVRVCISIAAGQ